MESLYMSLSLSGLHTTAVPNIIVKNADQQDLDQPPEPGERRILDVGSANYPLDGAADAETLRHRDDPSDYKHRPDDVAGEIAHRVLFDVVGHALDHLYPDTKLTIYINDISREGLERAAYNLAQFIGKQGASARVAIKIVTIVGDIFNCQLPRVDECTYIHPADYLIGLLLCPQFVKGNHAQATPENVKNLFVRLAATSNSGVLVSETNYGGGMGDSLIDTLRKGITMDGVQFSHVSREEVSHISPYRFPSGLEIPAGLRISYRATLATSRV